MPAQRDFSTCSAQAVGASGSKKHSSPINQEANVLFKTDQRTNGGSPDAIDEEQKQLRAGDWARVLNAATQRRAEILMPENLENMWSRGRNYKKKEAKRVKRGEPKEPLHAKSSGSIPTSNTREFQISVAETNIGPGEKALVRLNPTSVLDTPLTQGSDFKMDDFSKDDEESFIEDNHEDTISIGADGKRTRLKRSSSTSALKVESDSKKALKGEVGGSIISEFYSQSVSSRSGEYKAGNASDVVYRSEGPHTPKLRCRVRKILQSCQRKKY